MPQNKTYLVISPRLRHEEATNCSPFLLHCTNYNTERTICKAMQVFGFCFVFFALTMNKNDSQMNISVFILSELEPCLRLYH